MNNPADKSKIRFHYLDGARGIAAFSVFIYHVLDTPLWHDTKYQRIVGAIFNGGDAVSFFFVLSGFVLSYKYLAPKPERLDLPLKSYVSNRIWRLYPAFVFTLGIYYYLALRHAPGPFWENLYNSRNIFINEALLVKGVNAFNYADWTLTQELCISFILPFLMAAAIRHRRWLVAMTLLFFIGNHVHSNAMVNFCIGMLLAYYYRECSVFRETRPRLWKWRWPILIGSFLIFGLRQSRHLNVDVHHFLEHLYENFNITEFELTALASGIFIIYFFNSKRAQWVLSSPPIHYLGKISYSLYLLQALWANNWNEKIIVFVKAHIAQSQGGILAAYILIGGTGLVLSASIVHYLVEAPFHRVGKRFSKRYFSGRKAALLPVRNPDTES